MLQSLHSKSRCCTACKAGFAFQPTRGDLAGRDGREREREKARQFCSARAGAAGSRAGSQPAPAATGTIAGAHRSRHPAQFASSCLGDLAVNYIMAARYAEHKTAKPRPASGYQCF